MPAQTANLAPLSEPARTSWSLPARLATSAVIGLYFVGVVAAELAAPPASPLEREIASAYRPIYEILDQGRAHRFYSDIGPTPILLAELSFGDDRPRSFVRIPDRSVRPRIVYQRQLALANAASEEYRIASTHDRSLLERGEVAAIAHRLAREHPGCVGVRLSLQQHQNPDPGRLLAAARGDAPPIDPDSDEFLLSPDLLGEYPWPPR